MENGQALDQAKPDFGKAIVPLSADGAVPVASFLGNDSPSDDEHVAAQRTAQLGAFQLTQSVGRDCPYTQRYATT